MDEWDRTGREGGAMSRVLFVNHVDRILGGAEVNLLELLSTAAAAEQWTAGCACAPASPLSAALEPLRVKQFGFVLGPVLSRLRIVGRRASWGAKLAGWRALRQAREHLAQIAGQFQPRLVISCTNKDHFCAGPVCRRIGVPSVWWVNDALSPEFFPWPVRWWFCRQARRWASRLVVVSDFAREVLLRQGLPPGLVSTIHNGLPLAHYHRQPQGCLAHLLNLPPEQHLVGIVGRLTPWKGQAFFLRLARAWVQEGQPAHFALIGRAFNEDQPYESALRQFVADSGLGTRVHFIPSQVDIPGVLSDLDLLVHASLKPEPFGRVLIEAMAVGVPVIAARAGGVPEIITDGVDGLLAEPGDLGAYLAALRRVLGSPATARALAEAGRHTVEQRFTIQRVQRQFAQLLAELAPG
jgi:glycosyltransferase involved in cell wall biosynthesis